MTGKRAIMPKGFDFSESRDKLEGIIKALPNPAGDATSTRLQAKEILALWRLPTLVPNDRIAKKSEATKVDEIEMLTKKLSAAWRDLDPDLQHTIKRQLTGDRFVSGGTFSTDTPRAIFSFVEFGPTLIKVPFDVAREAIRQAKPAGRTKWPAVRIVHACSLIWADRLGKIPSGASNTRWASFVQDVFNCLGIEASAENSIRAWRDQ